MYLITRAYGLFLLKLNLIPVYFHLGLIVIHSRGVSQAKNDLEE